MQEYTIPNEDREVSFIGQLLGTASSFRPSKDRWFELSIYKTEGGNYVIAGAGKTTVSGEDDRCWVKISETAVGAVEALHQYDDDGVRYLTHVARTALEESCLLDEALCAEFKLQRVR